MAVNWDEVKKAISPIKDFEDLCRRLQVSFSYPFVGAAFNFSMAQLADYSKRLLGGDTRGRYEGYAVKLNKIIKRLEKAGVINVLELMTKTANRKELEDFVERSGVEAVEVMGVLKFLIYWLIPNEKYLSGLVRNDLSADRAIKVLSDFGIRTNLELLQQGITTAGRKSLADKSGLPVEVITQLVNRADFSRMPWASKATISNIIGAGYGSLAELANANPERLYEDFFRYGKSIGKNLKLGNEIESSYRIAKIVPILIRME